MSVLNETSQIVSAADHATTQIEKRVLSDAMTEATNTEESLSGIVTAVVDNIGPLGGLSMESLFLVQLALKANNYHSTIPLDAIVPSLESVAGQDRTQLCMDQIERYRNLVRSQKGVIAERLGNTGVNPVQHKRSRP